MVERTTHNWMDNNSNNRPSQLLTTVNIVHGGLAAVETLPKRVIPIWREEIGRLFFLS